MHQDHLCAILTAKYYQPIYRYCYAKLGYDEQAAMDCAQETFLIMIQKQHELNLADNMQVWLYKTADRVMRNYCRREQKHQHTDMETLNLSDDGGFAGITAESPLDALAPKERALLTAYYDADRSTKEALAEQLGITLTALYNRIRRIKAKLKPPR